MFLVLSAATMISLDETMFLMSFFMTCENVFFNSDICINETKSLLKALSLGYEEESVLI